MFSKCMGTRYVDLDTDENNRISCNSFEDATLHHDRSISLGSLMANDPKPITTYPRSQHNTRIGDTSPRDIGWVAEDEMRPSAGRKTMTRASRLSNLDLDLFMSTKIYFTWSTTHQSRHAALSDHAGFENAVATKVTGGNHWSCTVKANMVMHEGEHYFEVELLPACLGGGLMVGVAREEVDPNACHHNNFGNRPQRAWLTFAMLGKGRQEFNVGDRVGVYVDLTAGTLMFFRNGKLIRRPKQVSGQAWQRISGPVVPAVQLFDEGDAVRFISDATVPEVAIKDALEKDFCRAP